MTTTQTLNHWGRACDCNQKHQNNHQKDLEARLFSTCLMQTQNTESDDAEKQHVLSTPTFMFNIWL